jgi:tetratricopeptide (TPR) repeat protein
MLSRFQLAAEDFERVIASTPDDLAVFSEENQAEWYFCLAQAYLGAGREDEYRRICQQMRRRFDVLNNAQIYFRLAEASVRTASTFDNWSEMRDAAQRHANSDSVGPVRAIRVRAAISFRAGDYQEAIRLFEQLAQMNSQTAGDLAFLSMAYYNLGQTELAREKLTQARASAGEKVPVRSMDLWAHIETRIALNEATALFGEPVP